MSSEPRDYLLRHIAADYDLVWDVVRNRIPELRAQIGSLLEV